MTVQVHDNGGAANGGVDTSAAQTFTITVTASQRRAELHEGRRSDGARRRGAQTVAGGPRPSAPGRPTRPGRSLDFIVSNNNNALFSAQPAVAPNGTLTYTPAANASGSATVTVQIHDNGGSAQRRRRHQRGADVHHHGHRGQRRAELHQGREPDRERRRGRADRSPDGPPRSAPDPPTRLARRSTSSSATTTTACSPRSRRSRPTAR